MQEKVRLTILLRTSYFKNKSGNVAMVSRDDTDSKNGKVIST